MTTVELYVSGTSVVLLVYTKLMSRRKQSLVFLSPITSKDSSQLRKRKRMDATRPWRFSSFLVSLDGTLATYDLRKQTSDPSKLLYRSACLSEDLTAITSLKSGRVIATSTSEGALLLFDTESRLDQCKHRFKINTPSLDHMVRDSERQLETCSAMITNPLPCAFPSR